jgi:hypothetical protein
MYICSWFEKFVFRVPRKLKPVYIIRVRRADHSSREGLPCVCTCVIKKPRKGGQWSILDYKRLWMNEYIIREAVKGPLVFKNVITSVK